jgi:Hus1-like protein
MEDPEVVNLSGHPSARRPANEFSSIKIDAKDWSNLLRVSVVAKSMLACTFPSSLSSRPVGNNVGICVDRALVLYVYITDDTSGEGPMLTYYIPAHL